LHSSVRALRVLAISDQNKAFLADKNHRTIKLLVRVVKEFVEGVGGGRAGGGGNDTISPSLAVLALLELSFIHSEDEDLPKLFPASLDLMSLLQKFMKMMKEKKLVLDGDASEDDVTMKESEQAAANLLGRLGYKRLEEEAKVREGKREEEVAAKLQESSASATSVQGASQHVMLSYCWNKNASPHLVKELGEKLKSLGVEVWRDEDGSALVHKMEGSTDETMALAIENAAVMIVFCSQEYKESSNCRLECKYAKRLEKGGKLKLIFVMMQDGYFDKADGWLGMYLGDSLWYGLWNDSQMDGAVDSISKLLGIV
jgi:hypothetical protein